jgi:hypothetical protein
MRAPVAQVDRAAGFEPVGRGFESLRARQITAVKSGWFGVLPVSDGSDIAPRANPIWNLPPTAAGSAACRPAKARRLIKTPVVNGLDQSLNCPASNVLVPPLHYQVPFPGLPGEALIGIPEYGRQFHRLARHPGW